MPTKIYTDEMKEFIISLKNTMRAEAWKQFQERFPEVQTNLKSFSIVRSRLGAVQTNFKPWIWNDELVKELKAMKGMEKADARVIFCEKHPHISFNAFNDHWCRVGNSAYKNPHNSTKALPLWSMRLKKGNWQIKVAMPGTWMSLAKWLYLEYNPGTVNEISKTDSFYWADGDNTNHHPENVLLVHRREQTVFMHMGGVVKGNAEATKLNLLNARLKLAMLDAGEKLGLVAVSSTSKRGSRSFKSERNAKRRAYHKKCYAANPEKYRALARKQNANMTPEQRERKRAYQREWARQRREKMKNEGSKN